MSNINGWYLLWFVISCVIFLFAWEGTKTCNLKHRYWWLFFYVFSGFVWFLLVWLGGVFGLWIAIFGYILVSIYYILFALSTWPFDKCVAPLPSWLKDD